MPGTYPPIGYTDYLKIEPLLSLQKLRSEEFGAPAHDEMLFIIVHQTYELWFKQILTELDSALEIFRRSTIDEINMGIAVSRLRRIVEIQKILIQQITVLETMTPMDFLDFRDYLYPASGFQSLQNRLIENKLGLRRGDRVVPDNAPYEASLPPRERTSAREAEAESSLFDLVDTWLARTPFLQVQDFNFWQLYREAVVRLFSDDREVVKTLSHLDGSARERNLKEIDATEATFQALFDESRYKELQDQGHFRMSYRALHATLLIFLYRHQPVLSLPFQVLTALQDIDELMTTWRYRHSLMAHRMLGRKIGTGGSSGASYLKDATNKHRIFNDLFNISSFLIPRSKLPDLPEKMVTQLGFYYSAATPRA